MSTISKNVIDMRQGEIVMDGVGVQFIVIIHPAWRHYEVGGTVFVFWDTKAGDACSEEDGLMCPAARCSSMSFFHDSWYFLGAE